VQDGALFDGEVVMTDLTPALHAVLRGLASCADGEGRLSVLVGPAETRGRAAAEFDRVGVRAVTVARTAPGEFGSAAGVARLELERRAKPTGVSCAAHDIADLAGRSYLDRLATLLDERDGPGAGARLRASAEGRGTGDDRWLDEASDLATRGLRTALHEIDLGDAAVPRFGIFCLVLACC
jgi:hypothetical protein